MMFKELHGCYEIVLNKKNIESTVKFELMQVLLFKKQTLRLLV